MARHHPDDTLRKFPRGFTAARAKGSRQWRIYRKDGLKLSALDDREASIAEHLAELWRERLNVESDVSVLQRERIYGSGLPVTAFWARSSDSRLVDIDVVKLIASLRLCLFSASLRKRKVSLNIELDEDGLKLSLATRDDPYLIDILERSGEDFELLGIWTRQILDVACHETHLCHGCGQRIFHRFPPYCEGECELSHERWVARIKKQDAADKRFPLAPAIARRLEFIREKRAENSS